MRLRDKDAMAREGPAGWSRKADSTGRGLVGRTLGSLGLGSIGREMFRLAAPLDMVHIAHDPFVGVHDAAALGVRLVDLPTLFRESDVLAVNCLLTQETRHLVSADMLRLMKATAFLINTARGPIIDQGALTEALLTGRLAGAGLDVFEEEPPDPDDPILRLDNVILAPHALCWTDQLAAGNGAADVAAVLAILEGRDPTNIVNKEVLETDAWRQRISLRRRQAGLSPSIVSADGDEIRTYSKELR